MLLKPKTDQALDSPSEEISLSEWRNFFTQLLKKGLLERALPLLEKHASQMVEAAAFPTAGSAFSCVRSPKSTHEQVVNLNLGAEECAI